jgi:hypothetical protein
LYFSSQVPHGIKKGLTIYAYFLRRKIMLEKNADRTKENLKNSAKKLDYCSPLLTCYGRVSELTQAGSAVQSEDAAQGGFGCGAVDLQRACT